MTRNKKIERIAELEKVLIETEKTGDWTTYNNACDEIGKLNRSMIKNK
jgi:hypothetical protein